MTLLNIAECKAEKKGGHRRRNFNARSKELRRVVIKTSTRALRGFDRIGNRGFDRIGFGGFDRIESQRLVF